MHPCVSWGGGGETHPGLAKICTPPLRTKMHAGSPLLLLLFIQNDARECPPQY